MRRVLGEAGDRYVRDLVKKRTVLSAEEIQLMQQRAIALQSSARKRSDMLRAFRKSALCLSISAKSSLSLKEVAELSAAELVEQVQVTPTVLSGWLWGDLTVDVDQVPTLVVGTSRQLLKLSRNYMRSLMEPLASDVLRDEEVLRKVLSRANDS